MLSRRIFSTHSSPYARCDLRLVVCACRGWWRFTRRQRSRMQHSPNFFHSQLSWLLSLLLFPEFPEWRCSRLERLYGIYFTILNVTACKDTGMSRVSQLNLSSQSQSRATKDDQIRSFNHISIDRVRSLDGRPTSMSGESWIPFSSTSSVSFIPGKSFQLSANRRISSRMHSCSPAETKTSLTISPLNLFHQLVGAFAGSV